MAIRNKMSREERAKQFMPFAALKGYEAALREKERIVVDKLELTEEIQNELDYKISNIELRDMITVVYYSGGEYLKITGMVSRIDMYSKILKVVNTDIPFSDIYDLQSEKLSRKMDLLNLDI